MAPSADWHAPQVLFVKSSPNTTLGTVSRLWAGSGSAGTGIQQKADIRKRAQMVTAESRRLMGSMSFTT
jgi:hypothetical protein